MKVARLMAVILLFTAAAVAASQRTGPKTSSDLFETFGQLDTQFTKLDGQFRDLQSAVAKRQSKSRWRAKARKVQATTSRISRVTSHLYRHGQAKQQLRYRMFSDLYHKARTLNARLSQVQHASSTAVASREIRKAQRAMLDLVLQYQAISGGYAAMTCDAGTWSCGVAKPEPRKAGYPSTAVKWACVPRAQACRGILGPRTPLLAPQALTAVTTKK